jgi:hypothetical protein
MWLSSEHRSVLQSLASGSTLKAHRTLDGAKVYKLHPLTDDPPTLIADPVVEYLRKHRLIDSNMKFPAAVYLLTDKGAALAVTLLATTTLPITTKLYSG